MSFIVMLIIGSIGGFLSGMLGIGGAIIIFPAILLIPPLLGMDTYSAYVASGLTSLQVFFSTGTGTLKVVNQSNFSKVLLKYMGGGIFLGSVIGAITADLFSEIYVNRVYIFVAIIAFLMMVYKPKKSKNKKKMNRFLLVLLGVTIGLLSGVVGAGGAFIVIPVLISIFKQPMNIVISNSIVISFIASIAAFIIKLFQGYIPFEEGLALVLASILITPIGVRIGHITPDVLQKWLISIIILLSIFMI